MRLRRPVRGGLLAWTVVAILALAPTVAPSAGAIGGPFELAGTDGRRVTDADFRGKWMVVYFGYRSCPDVCPTVLTELGTTLEKLGPLAAKLQVVFVTLDPERDTNDALRDYLGSFDRRIVALRGSDEATKAVAKAYHVYVRARSLGNGDYAIDHSSFLYVMRPDGSFGELLAGDMLGHRLADELRRLVQ